MVHISKSINRKGLNGSASYEITTPKNKSSYRDILLLDNLLNLLLQHYKSCQQIDGFLKNHLYLAWTNLTANKQFVED